MADWIDAHTHLADERLARGLDTVLARSRAAGITAWVQGGVDPLDWARQLEMKKSLGKSMVTAFGLHPWKVAAWDDAQIESAVRQLERWLPEADALGETGLDKARDRGEAEALRKQTRAFETQLALARKFKKPLILHVVHAHEEAIRALRKTEEWPSGGMIHSFSGSFPAARQYVDMGFMISIGGSITRESNRETRNTVQRLPGEYLLIETDSPDQTPTLPGLDPKSLNEPRNLLKIAEVVGRLRGEQASEVLERSTKNIKRLFKDKF